MNKYQRYINMFPRSMAFHFEKIRELENVSLIS